VVSHDHINKNDYCTISTKGVARMRNDDETEFVPLSRWEHEYKNFKKLIQVRECFHYTYCIASQIVDIYLY